MYKKKVIIKQEEDVAEIVGDQYTDEVTARIAISDTVNEVDDAVTIIENLSNLEEETIAKVEEAEEKLQDDKIDSLDVVDMECFKKKMEVIMGVQLGGYTVSHEGARKDPKQSFILCTEDVKDALKSIWDFIKNIFKWIADKVKQFIDWVKSFFKSNTNNKNKSPNAPLNDKKRSDKLNNSAKNIIKEHPNVNLEELVYNDAHFREYCCVVMETNKIALEKYIQVYNELSKLGLKNMNKYLEIAKKVSAEAKSGDIDDSIFEDLKNSNEDIYSEADKIHSKIFSNFSPVTGLDLFKLKPLRSNLDEFKNSVFIITAVDVRHDDYSTDAEKNKFLLDIILDVEYIERKDIAKGRTDDDVKKLLAFSNSGHLVKNDDMQIKGAANSYISLTYDFSEYHLTLIDKKRELFDVKEYAEELTKTIEICNKQMNDNIKKNLEIFEKIDIVYKTLNAINKPSRTNIALLDEEIKNTAKLLKGLVIDGSRRIKTGMKSTKTGLKASKAETVLNVKLDTTLDEINDAVVKGKTIVI